MLILILAARFGCRHTQVMLMGLSFFCCYAVRVTTSVTLEAMTNAKSANPDFEVRITIKIAFCSDSKRSEFPSFAEGVWLERIGQTHDPQFLLLGIHLHANTREHHHPAMERPGTVLGDPYHRRSADPRQSVRRSLWWLAGDDRCQNNLRSRSRCRSTVSSYLVIQMVATRGTWKTMYVIFLLDNA